MVKSAYCSCRFGCPCPCQVALITVSHPVPRGNLMPLDCVGTYMHMAHTNSDTQIKIKFKKDLKVTRYFI